MTRQSRKPPTRLEVWDKCHKKVGSDPNNPQYTTPGAMRIAVISNFYFFHLYYKCKKSLFVLIKLEKCVGTICRYS